LSAERLQKVLASAGIASRRDCEELISAGRVSVNGKAVLMAGTRVDPEQDEIAVDGRPIGQISPRTYVMLNKPAALSPPPMIRRAARPSSSLSICRSDCFRLAGWILTARGCCS